MQMRMIWSIRKIQLLFRTTIAFIQNSWDQPSKCRVTNTKCIKSTQAKSFKASSDSLSSISQKTLSCLPPNTSNTISKSKNSFSPSRPTKWTRCFTHRCISSSNCSKMRWWITLIPDKITVLKIYSSNSMSVPVAQKSKDTKCSSLWRSESSVLWLTPTKNQCLCLQVRKSCEKV